MKLTPYFKKELDKNVEAQWATIDLFETTHKIAKKQNYKTALEIGVAWAITTIAILSAGKGKLWSVDSAFYPNTESQVKKLGYEKRWMFIERKSQEILPELVLMKQRFDLICVDGSHYYEDVKEDMENSIALLGDDGVIIVDDYTHKNNWEGDYGVARAVNETIKRYKLKFKPHKKAHGIMELRRN